MPKLIEPKKVVKDVSGNHQLFGEITEDNRVYVTWESWFGYEGADGQQPLSAPYYDDITGWRDYNTELISLGN